jgi:hypothetical protein
MAQATCDTGKKDAAASRLYSNLIVIFFVHYQPQAPLCSETTTSWWICNEGLQHFTLVINRAPQVVPLVVDLHENLVQGPLLIRVCTHFLDTFMVDFSGKNRAKSIPPASQSFVADVDPALAQQVLDIAERKWKSNVHHDRQADDLGLR